MGRWADGMSRGSVLTAGGGLSSKNKNVLHKLQHTANTIRKTKKRTCVCLQVWHCAYINTLCTVYNRWNKWGTKSTVQLTKTSHQILHTFNTAKNTVKRFYSYYFYEISTDKFRQGPLPTNFTVEYIKYGCWFAEILVWSFWLGDMHLSDHAGTPQLLCNVLVIVW